MRRNLFLIFVLAVSLLCFGISAAAKDEKAPVSTGLQVIAYGTDMAKTALVGENIEFSKDDFRRALNLSDIENVTFTTVPEPTEGRLLFGNAALAAGQSISGENLGRLRFVPASEDVRSGSFTFSTGEGYSIKCNFYFVEKANYSPTVSLAAETALNINTHSAVSRTATLDAYDPEGDSFVYEIVSYPKNGSVVLTNRDSGNYVYTPASGFTGDDKFSYVARDVYGNYSAMATVSVNVSERATSVSFADIDDCNVYNAALTMAEKSLMSGTEIDGQMYFVPAQSITRAEFLATAMRALGISDPGDITEGVFADGDDIPGEYKGYVNAAYKLGFINGSEVDGELCFLPNATVTRAEAAVMLNAIIASSKETAGSVLLPVFADSALLPAWADDAIYNMNSLGVMKTLEGYASPDATVSRGEAAEMFEAVIHLFE